MMRFRIPRAVAVSLLALAVGTSAPTADTSIQFLPFTQDWTDTTLIATNDLWTGVPGIVGYRGDAMTAATGVDPQTVVGEGGLIVDVNANQTAPNTFSTGGVAEFEGANVGNNPVVALTGSGTARAPHIVIAVNTTGLSNITVAYNLRDLDGSADNALSPVALQFRIGGTGNYTNVPAGFVTDATEGPSAAGKVTPVSAVLPPEAANQPFVQIRVITTDAAGNDEWVGIDDISVTGSETPEPTNPTGVGAAQPPSVAPGATSLLAVQVTPGQNPVSTGLTVTADLTPILGNAAQPFFDDGTHGDVTAGDDLFSFLATIGLGTPSGAKILPATIADAEGRTGSAAIALNVFVPITSVVISQVYGGGGNSGAVYQNDFIELYNRSSSPVDLTDWSVQYASAGGTSWQATPLSGVMQPGTYYLVWEASGAGNGVPLPPADATGAIAMSASSGKVVLSASASLLTGSCPEGASIVDLVGYGTANCFEGAGAAPELSASTAAIRIDGGATDTNNNQADFVEDTPSAHNQQGQPPTGIGAANPTLVDSGDTSLLTVAVTPGSGPTSTGITVTGDLTQIGGGASQPFFDDGSNGDVTPGDLTFSISATVTGTQGAKTITAAINDQQGRTSTTTFTVIVQPDPIAIHTIQGAGLRSPFESQIVTTTGIVTALRASSFYIQTPPADVDADPETSEAIVVFTGFPRPSNVALGDLVRVAGTVVEFLPGGDPSNEPVTEIAQNPAIDVLSSGHPLPPPALLLPEFTDPSGNFAQLERFEAMRVMADVRAVSGTARISKFGAAAEAEEAEAVSESNGDFFVVINGVPRPRREPGIEESLPLPPGAPPTVPRFDENPERMRVDSDGQSGASKIEIVAGQTIAGLTGVLDYGFRAYTIVPDPATWVPAQNGAAVPVPMPGANEFTVAAFNLERFFDDVDNGINEPVMTATGMERRLNKASLAIRNVLRLPDILAVEEVEHVSILNRLAQRVNADEIAAGRPSPWYIAYLEEGNDIGGIDSGFLVKSARVTTVAVTQYNKTETYVDPDGDTAILNDRPPLVLQAEIRGPVGAPYPVTVIVNHLRSLSGIAGGDGARIREKRRKQAESLAQLVQQLQTASPDARVISVGDYNAFDVNDGYVDVLSTVLGHPAPADQVVLASPDLVNPNLTDLDQSLGEQRYSFVFDGNAQSLDHILVNARLLLRPARVVYGRANADFPESFRSDGSRPERLSDHDPAVAYFSLPGTPIITLNGSAEMTVECGSPFVDPGASASDPDLGPIPYDVTGAVDTTVCGTYTLTYTAFNGFVTSTATRTVHVADTASPVLTLNGSTTITLEAGTAFTDPGATASDVCAGTLDDAIQVSGSVNTTVPGTYVLTYSVGDGFNTTTATRTVVVVDTTGPALGPIGVTPSLITVVNHRMIDVAVSYVATDVTGTPVCSAAVTSDEPVNALADGSTLVDWQVISPTHVRVRAERSALGDGRTYTITISCVDASGNQTSGTAAVHVIR